MKLIDERKEAAGLKFSDLKPGDVFVDNASGLIGVKIDNIYPNSINLMTGIGWAILSNESVALLDATLTIK